MGGMEPPVLNLLCLGFRRDLRSVGSVRPLTEPGWKEDVSATSPSRAARLETNEAGGEIFAVSAVASDDR